VRRLRGQDAAFLYGETPTWHMHVASVLTIDPTGTDFSFERFKQLLVARLPQVPQFRWKPINVPFGLDRPYWVEDLDFDPDYHIRRVGVPAPGGRRELEELVGRLLGIKLHRDHPLWELWLLEGLEGGRVAAFAKVHHSVIDGVSGAGLGEIIMDVEPTPRPADPTVVESLHDERVPNDLELLAGGLINVAIRTPVRSARFVRQSVDQLLAMRSLSRKGPVTLPFGAPRTPFNDDVSAHRSYGAASVPLVRVKAIKEAAGVKLNDVVLALCAGILRTWLLAREELPSQALVAAVPVSTRGDDERDQVGNRVSQMYVSLATDVADTAERLRAIYASSQSAKEMRQALDVRSIQGITEMAPPALVGLAARAVASAGLARTRTQPFNLIISNIPGPPFPLYVAGAVVESMIPIGPLVAVGLNITVFSYIDRIDMGIVTCPEIVPDVAAMADLLESELMALEAAYGIKPAKPIEPDVVDLNYSESSANISSSTTSAHSG
jgi:diacylglycerol O-acyltransferase